MTLPTFSSVRARKRGIQRTDQPGAATPSDEGKSSDQTLTTPDAQGNLKSGTNHRRNTSFVSSLYFLIATIFLLLVIIGCVSSSQPALLDIYFFQLDLSDIYPTAFGSNDPVFVNSIARSLGLHDFYRVGLWNFCEGYNDEGVTYCSPPQGLYYFNPVAILLNELLAGATITLPSQVVILLKVIEVASNLMFGFFLAACPMLFLNIFLSPFAHRTRWVLHPLAIFSTLAAILVLAGSIIATVMFAIFEIVITSQTELNIRASLGVKMLVFMWIATISAAVAAHLHLCMCCCCKGRKDGKKRRKCCGTMKASGGEKSRMGKTRCCGLRKAAVDVV